MLGFFETVTLTAIVTGVCRHEAYEDKCAAFAEQLRSETNTLLEPFEAWEVNKRIVAVARACADHDADCCLDGCNRLPHPNCLQFPLWT